MHSPAIPFDPAPSERAFRARPGWLFALLLVLLAQAGFALQLFDPNRDWLSLTDPRPILDGQHPLHLYHASLGGNTLRAEFTATCYDPNFQAGYPKTPVFDAGARPIEPLLALLGRRLYDPAAYKLALIALCLMVPLVIVVAARGFGVSAQVSLWCALAGCWIWWCEPIRSLLREGRLDLLGVGLAMLAFYGGLARYAREPGLTAWLVLAAGSIAGWFAHPFAWCGVFPAVAIFYVVQAPRHGLAWHQGAAAVLVLGLVLNLWWLGDWLRFWWVRHGASESRTPDWGRFLQFPDCAVPFVGCGGWPLLVVGLLGLAEMLRRQRQGTGALMGVGLLGLAAVTRLGSIWSIGEAEGFTQAQALIAPMLAIAGGFAVCRTFGRAKLLPAITVLLCGTSAFVAWSDAPHPLRPLNPRIVPFALGWNESQLAMIDAIESQTDRTARILIEDCGETGTALLPLVTDRLYLGGLDSQRSLEHGYVSLRDGQLASKPFGEWTVDDRVRFCRTYNIGWVLCRTPEAIAWWKADPAACELARPGNGGWVLYELDRQRSFVLRGKATVERMDHARIVLTDLVPDAEGTIVLSLHYQKQLRAGPMVHAVRPESDLYDPIPLLALKLSGPVSRVVLRWEHP